MGSRRSQRKKANAKSSETAASSAGAGSQKTDPVEPLGKGEKDSVEGGKGKNSSSRSATTNAAAAVPTTRRTRTSSRRGANNSTNNSSGSHGRVGAGTRKGVSHSHGTTLKAQAKSVSAALAQAAAAKFVASGGGGDQAIVVVGNDNKNNNSANTNNQSLASVYGESSKSYASVVAGYNTTTATTTGAGSAVDAEQHGTSGSGSTVMTTPSAPSVNTRKRTGRVATLRSAAMRNNNDSGSNNSNGGYSNYHGGRDSTKSQTKDAMSTSSVVSMYNSKNDSHNHGVASVQYYNGSNDNQQFYRLSGSVPSGIWPDAQSPSSMAQHHISSVDSSGMYSGNNNHNSSGGSRQYGTYVDNGTAHGPYSRPYNLRQRNRGTGTTNSYASSGTHYVEGYGLVGSGMNSSYPNVSARSSGISPSMAYSSSMGNPYLQQPLYRHVDPSSVPTPVDVQQTNMYLAHEMGQAQQHPLPPPQLPPPPPAMMYSSPYKTRRSNRKANNSSTISYGYHSQMNPQVQHHHHNVQSVPGVYPAVTANSNSGGGRSDNTAVASNKRKHYNNDALSAGQASGHSGVSRGGAQEPVRPDYDDVDGHYLYTIGEIISERYTVISLLGEGTFGKVLECYDMQKRKNVAVKIIKNIPKYRAAAKVEVQILDDLKKDSGCPYCIKLLDWFDYRHHICMVFELLGLSLYDFLKSNKFQPFPIDQIRIVGYQLLKAVRYMHSMMLTHTDLKPENILLVDSAADVYYDKTKKQEFKIVRSPDIQLIDFGSATFEIDHHTRIVSTRHYRAPEVILELGWSYPCDLWSVGCILMELYTGDALFQTHENMEHLAMMEVILGPFPGPMIKQTQKQQYFYKQRMLNWPHMASSSASVEYVSSNCKPLLDHNKHPDQEEFCDFFDLVSNLLVYEPSKRLLAAEALEHPFFSKLHCK
eukprot:Nk52_evm50s2579 gene=Nk52_evmTU50s2579